MITRIAIVGPGESGKDVAASWFAENTRLRAGLSTSQIIAPYVARKLGRPEAEVFAERRDNRKFWEDTGNELRAEHGADFLVREVLRHGDMAVGMRGAQEMLLARANSLFDISFWMQRDCVPPDETMGFGPELCNLIVMNNGSIDDLCRTLLRLALMMEIA